MEEKICSMCREPKALSEFNKHKKNKDGLRSECRLCGHKQYKKYREANPDKVAENHRKWREANRQLLRERSRKWREANPDKVAEITRRRDEDNREFKKWREAQKAKEAKQQEELPPDNLD